MKGEFAEVILRAFENQLERTTRQIESEKQRRFESGLVERKIGAEIEGREDTQKHDVMMATQRDQAAINLQEANHKFQGDMYREEFKDKTFKIDAAMSKELAEVLKVHLPVGSRVPHAILQYVNSAKETTIAGTRLELELAGRDAMKTFVSHLSQAQAAVGRGDYAGARVALKKGVEFQAGSEYGSTIRATDTFDTAGNLVNLLQTVSPIQTGKTEPTNSLWDFMGTWPTGEKTSSVGGFLEKIFGGSSPGGEPIMGVDPTFVTEFGPYFSGKDAKTELAENLAQQKYKAALYQILVKEAAKSDPKEIPTMLENLQKGTDLLGK